MVIFDVVEILEEFLIVDGLSNARLSIKSDQNTWFLASVI